jgi:DNA-directed RNA polymerase specialized sigma24 family protein
MSNSSFQATRWTLIRRAQQPDEHSQLALSELCDIYYEPVLHFARRWAGNEEDGKDLAHGFFEGLLTRRNLYSVDPSKGRFRNFLLASLKNFLLRQRAKNATAKRGGNSEQISMEEAETHAIHPDWDREFDRAWALALIQRATTRLADEMEASGRADLFAALRPWLDGGPAGDTAGVAASLNLSPAAMKVAVHRMRERFRRNVRQEITETASDPSDVQAEFRHLIEVWIRHVAP